MAGYYDVVLGLIPLVLLAGAGALTGVGFELTTAIPLASVLSVGLIGHALFVNGPVDDASASGSFQPAD